MPEVETTTTITYTYDSLNRLIAADFDSGEFFHYTYTDNTFRGERRRRRRPRLASLAGRTAA